MQAQGLGLERLKVGHVVLEEASYHPIVNAAERNPRLKEEAEAMAKAVATPEALAAQLSSAALKAIGQT